MTPVPRKVLVSACLLGRECRYDGRHNRDGVLERELERNGEVAVPFCPEQAGGLDTPRPPAWLSGGDARAALAHRARVVTCEGIDVTAEFRSGAEAALAECRAHGIERAYLKERSPSCGVQQTHVDDELVDGPGLTAALLQREGVEIFGVEGKREAGEAP